MYADALLAFENFDDNLIKMSIFFQVEEEASKSTGTQTIAVSNLNAMRPAKNRIISLRLLLSRQKIKNQKLTSKELFIAFSTL